ncbi:hypothetical protein PMIN01_04431 [Paraphaeosphaeria minitans]|uniref:Uncharacterized protein n=1 Tax=Paraphaeosphaeria minitans TaxID=565426 RepID=A0A9P6GJ21_9PLEO|nr:hypothetical protein PMIN01_04431 [Paraphaeosphaeria minitans]
MALPFTSSINSSGNTPAPCTFPMLLEPLHLIPSPQGPLFCTAIFATEAAPPMSHRGPSAVRPRPLPLPSLHLALPCRAVQLASGPDRRHHLPRIHLLAHSAPTTLKHPWATHLYLATGGRDELDAAALARSLTGCPSVVVLQHRIARRRASPPSRRRPSSVIRQPSSVNRHPSSVVPLCRPIAGSQADTTPYLDQVTLFTGRIPWHMRPRPARHRPAAR